MKTMKFILACIIAISPLVLYVLGFKWAMNHGEFGFIFFFYFIPSLFVLAVLVIGIFDWALNTIFDGK